MSEEQDLLQLLPVDQKEKSEALTTTPKGIIMNPGRSKVLDQQTVSFRFYNSFNYSLLHKNESDIRLALGITSANPQEGKSLVASNLAVSLTLGYKKKTVLVDLNINRPALHEIFGTPIGPGLLEALDGGDIHLWETPIDNLHLLSCGGKQRTNGARRAVHHPHGTVPRFLDLDQMTSFSDVITSLQQRYEFVILDLPAMCTEDFPILFANRLSGLLMVVDTAVTKREDIEKVFRRLNEQQVLGFILNKVRDEKK